MTGGVPEGEDGDRGTSRVKDGPTLRCPDSLQGAPKPRPGAALQDAPLPPFGGNKPLPRRPRSGVRAALVLRGQSRAAARPGAHLGRTPPAPLLAIVTSRAALPRKPRRRTGECKRSTAPRPPRTRPSRSGPGRGPGWRRFPAPEAPTSRSEVWPAGWNAG